uniref:FMN-binding protein MioC n=1 Tax=Thaumasiovibrio occultus TaxID=1891184 RepID=UPI000B360F51|nr:FMN-binding protein MioC [Thaumasiovibrio occultus]
MTTLHLLTGSTLGGAEYVADHLSDLFNDQGISTEIHNKPDLDALSSNDPWLIITSTHGAGELPDNIAPFFAQLQNSAARPALQYAIIALGDSSYDTFCAAGFTLDTCLQGLEAQRLCPVLTIDVTQHAVPEEAAEEWLSTFLPLICE